MDKNQVRIKIFVSNPSDVIAEVDSIRVIVDEMNKTVGKQLGYYLEILNWKYDTYTKIGDDAQDVINKQIEKEYDILISIIWMRLGTPTKRDYSGTAEEINRAINISKKLLVYFKTKVDDLKDIDIEELGRINAFKQSLSDKGLLYKEFNQTSEFEKILRINLSNIISEILNEENTTEEKKQKYSDIDHLLKRVEDFDETFLEIDVLEISDETNDYLDKISISLSSFTTTIEDLGKRIQKRTSEINKFNNIRDERLRSKKLKAIVDLLAGEFDDITKRFSTELPIFKNNFGAFIKVYPKVIYSAKKYKNNETEQLLHSSKHFKNAMETSVSEAAKFVETIMNFPPVNSKFNKSKRQLELVLKDIVKEMLTGLKIFDEIVD